MTSPITVEVLRDSNLAAIFPSPEHEEESEQGSLLDFQNYGSGSAVLPMELLSVTSTGHWESSGITVTTARDSNSLGSVWISDRPDLPPQVGLFIQSQVETRIQDAARSLLTPLTTRVLENLLAVSLQVARRFYIPISLIEVDRFIDPEEGNSELVVTFWVSLRSNEALRFWDLLGISIGSWTKTIPVQDSAIILDRISVDVQWLE